MTEVIIRPATPDDLAPYEAAFTRIAARPASALLVAEQAGDVVEMAQVSFMPARSHRGVWRTEIEAVRIRQDQRGGGIGSQLILACIEAARERNCGLIQLTSNASRTDARRFHERLGFAPSHIGFNMSLDRG